MTEQGYNGWTNYETWCVHLWMSNDEGSDEYFRDLARQALYNVTSYDDPDDETTDASFELKDTLEEIYDDLLEEAAVTGAFGDILRAALAEVNWYEIADHYIEAVKEEDGCESST